MAGSGSWWRGHSTTGNWPSRRTSCSSTSTRTSARTRGFCQWGPLPTRRRLCTCSWTPPWSLARALRWRSTAGLGGCLLLTAACPPGTCA
eukprot:12887725-Prorocentrum_lima.AAC.1